MGDTVIDNKTTEAEIPQSETTVTNEKEAGSTPFISKAKNNVIFKIVGLILGIAVAIAFVYALLFVIESPLLNCAIIFIGGTIAAVMFKIFRPHFVRIILAICALLFFLPAVYNVHVQTDGWGPHYNLAHTGSNEVKSTSYYSALKNVFTVDGNSTTAKKVIVPAEEKASTTVLFVLVFVLPLAAFGVMFINNKTGLYLSVAFSVCGLLVTLIASSKLADYFSTTIASTATRTIWPVLTVFIYLVALGLNVFTYYQEKKEANEKALGVSIN